ncbi:MAG: hypothetical protein CFE45_03640 [Burkholderiales bacterium PBB5]|nr:MAG: hypothetical protein CFE45_03640 [Burkholderiales bacterium PBB5]
MGLTYFFQKTGTTDTWNIYAAANGVAVVDPPGSTVAPVATVTFSSDGKTVMDIKDAAGSNSGADGVAYSPTSFPLPTIPSTGTGASTTEPIAGIKLNISGLTQYGNVFGPTDVSQDGFPPGRLSSIAVQPDGVLVASYSSGQSAPIAKLELASFRNVQGLQPLGGNSWAGSFESGDPVLGDAGGGNLGLLSSQSLEESNIDLTGELVNMMVAQRIYQANAQTIKTQDSVMQTLVNLR